MNDRIVQTDDGAYKELTELKREFAEVLDDAFEDKSYLVDKPQMIEEDALFEQVLDRAWEWVGQKLTQSNDEIKREAYILGYKAGWGDDAVYKTNGELEKEAKESFDGNKSLLGLTQKENNE